MMAKNILRKSFLMAASLCAGMQPAVASDTLHCDKEQRFKSGGFREAHAVLTLSGEAVQAFSYSGTTGSGQVGQAYSCQLDVARHDKNIRWKVQGQKTLVWLEDNVDPDMPNIEITRAGQRVAIEMRISPSPYCGFGAEFPSKMVRKSDGKCKVGF